MTMLEYAPWLRRVLLVDAAMSGGMGLLLALGAGPLAGVLALPEELLRATGLILALYGALVLYVATRERLPRPAVWALVVVNALWALDSAVLLLSGWVAPNALGAAFVAAQALVVALFAGLQYAGLRRRGPALA